MNNHPPPKKELNRTSLSQKASKALFCLNYQLVMDTIFILSSNNSKMPPSTTSFLHINLPKGSSQVREKWQTLRLINITVKV